MMGITLESPNNKKKANPVKACSPCKVGQAVLEIGEGCLGNKTSEKPHSVTCTAVPRSHEGAEGDTVKPC